MSRRSRLSVLTAIMCALFAVPSLHAADYATIHLQIDVNRPQSEVWKQVGADYCAIEAWLKLKCELISGTGDLGSVRRLNDVTIEPMVSKTPYSYTYWQSAGMMAPFSYHGTLSVEPNGAGKSRLFYTLFYDQGAMASDAVRASEHTRLTGRFQGALEAMKAIVEAKK